MTFDKKQKAEALKEIEKIFDNAGEKNKTVIIALQSDETSMKGACILNNVSLPGAAKMAIHGMLKNVEDQATKKNEAPQEIKDLIECKIGNDLRERKYKKLLVHLLEKAI